MRLPLAAALLLAPLAAPVVARAQPGSRVPFVGPTQAYTFSGCGTDDVPGRGQERVVCVRGTATLGVSALFPTDHAVWFDAFITPASIPGFSLAGLDIGGFWYSFVTTTGASRSGVVTFLVASAVDPADPSYNGYGAFLSIPSSGSQALPGSVRPIDGGPAPFGGGSTLVYRTVYAGAPSDYTTVPLTFAAIPEPATVVLTAAGLLALAGAGRWRAAA